MFRTLLIGIVAVAAVSIPAAATGSPNATLTGASGRASRSRSKNADGTGVRHLDPGSYDIAVTDDSIEHNFHLIGPGVDMATDVEARRPSLDRDVHRRQLHVPLRRAPTQMKGSFTVGNVPPLPPPPPPAAKLTGKVTARRSR